MPYLDYHESWCKSARWGVLVGSVGGEAKRTASTRQAHGKHTASTWQAHGLLAAPLIERFAPPPQEAVLAGELRACTEALDAQLRTLRSMQLHEGDLLQKLNSGVTRG